MTPSLSENWDDDLVAAEELIPIIGRLYRQNGVVLSIHGRSLINRNPVELLKAHRYARHLDGHPLPISKSSELIKRLDAMELGPASIDIARLLATGKRDRKSVV